MKRNLLHLIFLPVTAYMFYIYTHLWDEMSAIEISSKPFVYRTLVPLLAHILMGVGVSRVVAFTAVLAVALIGFIISLKELASRVSDQWNPWVVSYVASWGLFLLVLADAKSYDLMTAFLMTLSFLLIYDRKINWLFVVFPAVCLNRETAFLVVIFCAIWFWKKIKLEHWLYLLTVLSVTFFVVQYGVRAYFMDAEGVGGTIYLFQNLSTFWSHPVYTLILVVGMLIIVVASLMNWKNKSEFVRLAFLSTFPIIFVLYLVFGFGYEVRVFVEAYPFTFLLITENLT